MAGIRVPQYEVFKIGTDELKYSNWDLTISKHEARLTNKVVALFQAQEFRLIAKILDKPIDQIDFSKYICSIVIDKMTDFKRATDKKGITINGNTFRRFVGTTGGLKNNTLLMVNVEIIDELNRRCECGRNPDIALVPSKYEAYKALTCSASQVIVEPRGILVVRDCITKIKDDIISLDNSDDSTDSPTRTFIKDCDIENTASDGFNLCSIGYMELVSEGLGLDYVTNGVCLRNAWLKGMMYPFPILEFIEKYHTYEDGTPNYFVEDIWGNMQDLREIDMILTESSLKLWSSYTSIDDYVQNYRNAGYEFAITKISPHQLEDYRELNYQYIQSYDLDDNDIKELCDPTINDLRAAMCGTYEDTLNFIGGSNDIEFSWQKALQISPYMLKDPYVIDCVHRMIKKKIDSAKIGKLKVHGNYQIASGDPFALMQAICGLEVTGLLSANECYSSYWVNEDVDELVIFRSPMTCHSNIRKCKVLNNDDTKYWYQYMNNVMIINAWDTFCQSENGCDFDGDLLFSTNNSVLIRKHITLPAVVCAQNNTSKVIVTEDLIKKSNKNGMGNKVGTITNRVTAMIEVQSRFDKGSKEYEALAYRIECGQLYQQDEIDKIKGIVSRPMPNYWYSVRAEECKQDAFLKSISIDKKPYFMIYVYDDYKKKLKTYLDKANVSCMDFYECSINELMQRPDLTEDQLNFIDWFERMHPFGMGPCAMNRVCWYVEQEMDGYKSALKHSSDFDYNKLKKKHRCTNEHRQALEDLASQYIEEVREYKNQKARTDLSNENVFMEDYEQAVLSRQLLQKTFKEEAERVCPNDDERLNIVLDMCYQYKTNMQFCWDVIGELICNRLEELNNEAINN